jgi:Potential Queuosine, Q, salvage protein family
MQAIAGRSSRLVALPEEVRERSAKIAASAQSVRIDIDALQQFDDDAPAATLDPTLHYLDASPEDVTRYFLTLDAINFGSGWFPTLRKRPGHSGYATIAGALTDQFRAHGPWSNEQLRRLDTQTIADTLDQPANHELMSPYAQALRDLGRWLNANSALEAVGNAHGSAERLASQLATAMALFRDPFYKRAQLLPADLALAGVAQFDDLDALTIFADNVVPHVLRCDGVLIYDGPLAARIDAEQPLPPGRQEREIRACAVQACEQIAARLSVPARVLDNWLWNRGQGSGYKARPRHRCRCVFY